MIIKILAVGLTLSQLYTKPLKEFKANFDEKTEQALVEAQLHEGCGFILNKFNMQTDAEPLLALMSRNAKRLKAKAEQDAAAGRKLTLTQKLIMKLDMDLLRVSYKQFCKGEVIKDSPLKMDEVIAFYNDAMKDLDKPADTCGEQTGSGEGAHKCIEYTKLKGLHLSEASTILDMHGERFSEVFNDNGHRHVVAIKDLPPYVPQALSPPKTRIFRPSRGRYSWRRARF